MALSDMKIGSKLLGSFVLVLTLAVAQSLFGVYQLREVNSKSTEIADHWLPSVIQIGEISSMANRLRAVQFQHVLTTIEADRKKLEGEMDSLIASLATEQTAYRTNILAQKEQQQFSAFEAEWRKYLEQRMEVVKLAQQRRDEEAQELLKGPAYTTFEASMTLLKSLALLDRQGGEQASTEGDALYVQAKLGIFSALALMVVLGLSIAWRLSGAISRGVIHAATVASQVAQGNLSSAIHISGKDEVGQLLSSLQDMQSRLARVVTQVRQGSDSVSTASSEIAEGNQDLSVRTENQATALQTTASSMDALNATVKQNASHARAANALAQSASQVAVKGGEVVAQVVGTMKNINDSSKKISDIISVIDGIAFQTNILALNAAVEAARAGEQGRGFAVVASEVRSLAGRSAEAAKEIKILISDSVTKVEQGTALVDQAGATMTEVVGSIKRVTDIMGDISAASTEQSLGVAQVGEAITQMDQATQQNAALVEEMAAAASSLKAQAQALVGTVSVFKLSATEPAPHAQNYPSLPHEPALRLGRSEPLRIGHQSRQA